MNLYVAEEDEVDLIFVPKLAMNLKLHNTNKINLEKLLNTKNKSPTSGLHKF